MNTADDAGDWVDVGDATSFEVGQLRQADLDGALVVLVRSDEGVVAFQGLCSHEGYPLVDGFLDRGALVCALHGSTFDLRTGDATLGPADQPLARYETAITDGRIRLLVPRGGLPVNE